MEGIKPEATLAKLTRGAMTGGSFKTQQAICVMTYYRARLRWMLVLVVTMTVSVGRHVFICYRFSRQL